MELCTTQVVSNLPNNSHHNRHHHHHHHHYRFLSINTTLLLRSQSALPPKQPPLIRSTLALYSRLLCFKNLLPRATTSEETSSGANRVVDDEHDGVVTLEEVPPVEKNVYTNSVPTEVPNEESPVNEQTQIFEFLDNLNIKVDFKDTYSILLYGSGALVALWFASAVVGAIDSIPLFPKLMEVVGLGYTLWFSIRYLLFKKNRDELTAKIEELKQQVLGLNDE
ncbi:DUF4308 domain-containing protein [Cephalotus follicularis]|uniref:DUF4308 domain-containing protein n=1 Tax=Cephalotus follicularis TaxID=3775 RepID=A0A1Q3AU08_CEPFO|nr:DUF4308 domain-containing protein [Cephalotus follicularis]